MNTQVIYLDASDSLPSIKNRLDGVRERRILLVFPRNKAILQEELDLTLLRRYAKSLDLQMGLVAVQPKLLRHARNAGIPTFLTIKTGKNKKRWPSYKRKSPQRPYPLPKGIAGEAHKRLKIKTPWRFWLGRYLGLFLAMGSLTFFLVGMAYALPAATITLQPKTQSINIDRQIIADPFIDEVDPIRAAVPARQIRMTKSWQATAATTGFIEIPDSSARGKVIFINNREQPANIPAGTRLSTTGGERHIFQTLASIEVVGGIGAITEAEISAIEPGDAGNVNSNLINSIEGPLALFLQVRNLKPTSGGVNRQVAAITQADQDRLREQVVAQLKVLAQQQMTAQLSTNEFLAPATVQIRAIQHETFSHFVGEAAEQLGLEIRAELVGTAVDWQGAEGLALEKLLASVPPDFSLLPHSFQVESGEIMGHDEGGRVTFMMMGKGAVAADLHLTHPLVAISGQPQETAMLYLYQNLPLQAKPQVQIMPAWLDRLPYMPARMKVLVQ